MGSGDPENSHDRPVIMIPEYGIYWSRIPIDIGQSLTSAADGERGTGKLTAYYQCYIKTIENAYRRGKGEEERVVQNLLI